MKEIPAHALWMWGTFGYLLGIMIALLIVAITSWINRKTELRDAQLGIPQRLADGRLYFLVPEQEYNRLFHNQMATGRYDQEDGPEQPRVYRT